MLCLNCNQTLTFDQSIKDRYPEWEAIIKSSSKESRKSQRQAPDASIRLGVSGFSPPSSINSVFDGQFSLLQHPVDKEEPNRVSSISKEIKTAENLFDIIANAETPIDHPICQECTNKLLDSLDTQLKFYEEECSEYGKLARQLTEGEDGVDLSCLKQQLDELQSEERALRSELAALETEESSLETDLQGQQSQLDAMRENEEKLWRSYRNHRRDFVELDNDRSNLQNQLNYAEHQLANLQKTDVFTLSFHLWHSGHFGTINGLRLGRLPSDPVDWQEINAAWGQATLLLVSLAKKLALTFDRYELIPFGNHSIVRVLKKPGQKDKDARDLPLYTSGGIKFFFNTDFDEAMVAYLDCLQQLKEKIESKDKDFCIPYAMQDGKILVTEHNGTVNTFSVKIQFNSEERWTKAMKYMLTNLKWAVAWVRSLQG